MQTSKNGISLLKGFEGCSLIAYPDPGTKDDPVKKGEPWTIGYGHTGKVKKGDVITQKEAEYFLDKDLIIHENNVEKLVKVPLNQNQFDALVSLEYNIGYGQFSTSTPLKKTNAKDFQAAADGFLLWNKSNGKVMSGLTRRRKAERELFLTPINAASSVPSTGTETGLPYDVVVTADALNIRSGAGAQHPVNKVVRKGTKLTVWAIETITNDKWGKNADGYFSLQYTK